MTPRRATGSITSNLLRHVEKLCSPELAGRLVGSEGEAAAREYLTEHLEGLGFRPAPGHAEPFPVKIPLLSRVPRLFAGAIELEYLVDFCVNVQGAAGGGRVEGPCVWVGGNRPDARVANRIVVCAPASPGSLHEALESYLQRHRAAREAGARGILQLSADHRRGKVMMHRAERPGLPSLDVSRGVVRLIFGTNEPAVGAVGAEVCIDVPLTETEVTSAGNVVMQFGDAPVGCFLVAHYDHVGAVADGRYFPGAADNASGVAVVLEAARCLAEGASSRGVVVLLTAAEEAGTRGAQHYVFHHSGELSSAPLVINVDEIGGDPRQPLRLLCRGAEPGPATPDPGWPVVTRPLSPGFTDDSAFVAHVPTVVTLTSASRPGVVHTLDDSVDALMIPKLVAATNLVVHLATDGHR